jgi:alanyl-tRNA synthetase
LKKVKEVNVLAVEISDSDPDTMRALADRFREKYPQNGVAVFTAKGSIIATVTDDLIKRGFKAGDFITGIGGKGGGRPNLAQGSLPEGNVSDALGKVTKIVEEKLK